MERRECSIKRIIVSFGGNCPFNCLHCYTFNSDYKKDNFLTVDEVILNLQNREFNITYISGHRENFINPDQGLELSERIFDSFSCDILITTRNTFNDSQIARISDLNKKMRQKSKNLYFCISIPAYESYKKLEPNPSIPTPEKRMDFLRDINNENIFTMLTIRPLCPSSFIPIDEPLRIIEKCAKYSTVVLSSGIVVDESILKRLDGFPQDVTCCDKPLMKCLNNTLSVKYVDVSMELKCIKKVCKKFKVPLFESSIPAIKFIKQSGNIL